jgi:outer membrane protein assembly factor BamD
MDPKRKKTMKKTSFVLIALVLSLLVDLGCRGKKTELTPEVASSDENLYNLGEKYIKKDPERARLYFRQVIDSFPKSFYAQQAKLAIADSYFKKGDEGSMVLAASEYKEFIHLYPFSPSAPYAQLQIAMTFFKKTLKPGRDQTKTKQALDEFRTVISSYPLSEEAKQAREHILQCEEKLAEDTFQIGKLYYTTKAYKGATSRLLELLNNYPNYSKMDRVYFYLGDSYYRWKKIDEAVPYFTKLISDFPKSKYAKKAIKRMKEIEKKKK